MIYLALGVDFLSLLFVFYAGEFSKDNRISLKQRKRYRNYNLVIAGVFHNLAIFILFSFT